RRRARGAWALAGAPAQGGPFLRDKLVAPAEPDDKRVARLVADLDADEFAVREKATADLEAMGKAAVPALRKALQDPPSAEVRDRATRILKHLEGDKNPNGGGQPGEPVLPLRAVEVLEHSGAPA